MATRKKIIPVTNIRAGDIPETDEEVEKFLEKMETKPKVVKKKVVERQLEDHELQHWVEQGATAKEQAERAEHANAGYPVMVKEEIVDVAANHEPGQPLPEDAAERAASGSGWQGEEIPDVKQKAKPTPKKTKIVKQPKPKKVTGVSKVTAQVVLTIFELARAGKTNAEIAVAESILVSYIGTILAAHPYWVKHTLAGFEAMGKQYPAKFTRPSKAAKNGQVQP